MSEITLRDAHRNTIGYIGTRSDGVQEIRDDPRTRSWASRLNELSSKAGTGMYERNSQQKSAGVLPILAIFAFCVAATSVLAQPSAPARKDAPAAQVTTETATNADGSQVRVSSTYTIATRRRVSVVSYRASRSANWNVFGRIVRSDVDEDGPHGKVHIVDWDRDRNHEVELTDVCGAGPNCDSVLYRIDIDSGQLVKLHEGAWSTIEFISGFLVAMNRASSAAWVADMHRVSQDRKAVDPRVAFSGFVGLDPDAKDPDQIVCYFYKTVRGDAIRRIKAPTPALRRRICDEYK